ncbi:MAG: dihydrodipicolinate synthase family protein [Armatimonadaceae bacterium]
METPLTHFTGLVAAPYTPFSADGSLNLSVVEKQVAHLGSIGVKGAFVCGTTGEGLSQTVEERKQVAVQWREIADSDFTLIVHTGSLCLSEAQELGRHAQEIGANGFAAIAPCFYRPATLDDLVEWCIKVASAAPELPFLYYHIPTWTYVDFPMAEFLPRAAERIPNFGGIKFTHHDVADYAATVQASGGSHALFFGQDEILLQALKVGGVAAVGSTYNYGAPIYHRVIAAYQSSNLIEAEAAQQQSADFVAVMQRHGGLPANKAIMRLCGVDCGPVRPPLRSRTPTEESALRTDLETLGFFDWLNA